MPVTAAVTSLLLSALPRRFSSLGSEMMMSPAERAKARTVPSLKRLAGSFEPDALAGSDDQHRAMSVLRDRDSARD
jgi:hypothetical protein